MSNFLFASGVANAYPVIDGGIRVDAMEECGHYDRWRDDFALAQDLGVRCLRWGPPLHKTFLGPGRCDWGWAAEALADLRRRRIEPVLGLCHFGVPDWLGNFQNPDFAPLFAEYAGECARQFPRVRYWEPVCEPLTAALHSALHARWNERRASDRCFVRALLNLCRANRLAMRAIREAAPDAVFVQSAALECHHPAGPDDRPEADFRNERRFLALDLGCGRPVGVRTHRYLTAYGMTPADYAFFMDPADAGRSVLGACYGPGNEHIVGEDGDVPGEVFGFATVAKQYYDRYGLPLLHAGTSRAEEPERWLGKQWQNVLRLRTEGVPVIGFTWQGLAGGLGDRNREATPLGRAFAELVRTWDGETAVEPKHLAGARPRFAAPALRRAG